ncbi:Replication initiator protein A (RepA) N-terminus [Hespellia stercorisuis DSM 15480]|uniref:Replication initiator protein A (RepA) N-terminus n=1 Tax=Hespellia stercorisuis DSM 15480 TaxID=1121950 RepID=A0A1M6PS18_9FIRM|nr:replication initiator protein A [Hespellia stercorisuis]SHK10726.1 Replication initiator protein A (RepA) N-terminus [Hespellia stercorisuis DSM 15480]
MSQKATFNYYYGQESDMYTFYRIPKLLFTHEYFRELSSDAKILYGLMLDRMSLSIKNEWFDDQNRAYIYFSVENIMELLNCGKNKAVKILQELDSEQGIGLIEKRRQGFGKANVIYVKNFVIEDNKEPNPAMEKVLEEDSDSGLKSKLQEVYKSNFKEFENQTSRIPKSKPQEVYISNPNYNNTVTVQNPLGELINFCTKQRIFKTCFAILFR